MSEDTALGGKLLAEVSRSFYLTLKALPDGVREPLSLAYLLARAADTLADTTAVSGAVRLSCLQAFDSVIQQQADADVMISQINAGFIPHQEDEGEVRLLTRLAEVLKAFAALGAIEKEMIRGVLAPIVKGQMLDIQRFPEDGELRALPVAADLDEYTYLVAGCVGEFWTRLCDAKLGKDFAPAASLDQMIRTGVHYGKGLQLVNILRDVAKDARMGRCYLPQEEIEAYGLSMEAIKSNPALLMPLTSKWRETARMYLQDGLAYLEALESKRLRYATALPLLLGFKTLALLDRCTEAEWLQGVKVPRGETTRLLFEAGLASASRSSMSRLARKCMG